METSINVQVQKEEHLPEDQRLTRKTDTICQRKDQSGPSSLVECFDNVVVKQLVVASAYLFFKR
jgi:hypothetical protein